MKSTRELLAGFRRQWPSCSSSSPPSSSSSPSGHLKFRQRVAQQQWLQAKPARDACALGCQRECGQLPQLASTSRHGEGLPVLWLWARHSTTTRSVSVACFEVRSPTKATTKKGVALFFARSPGLYLFHISRALHKHGPEIWRAREEGGYLLQRN